VFLTVGTKDRASAKDLVGALIKEAGLEKGQIGKIDVRETFSLVEVAPAALDQAVRAHDRCVGARQTSHRPAGSRVKNKRAVQRDGPFHPTTSCCSPPASAVCPRGMRERSTP